MLGSIANGSLSGLLLLCGVVMAADTPINPAINVRPIPADGPSAPLPPAAQPATAPVAHGKLISPEVAPDRSAVLRLFAPKASVVTVESLVGKFPMTRGEQGIWSITIGPLDPDVYEYTFNVDGVRFNDPANPSAKSPVVSFLTVPGEQPAPWELTNVPHGKVQFHWYQSKSLGVQRRVHVYTPPGYDPVAARQYSVLYLLHGSGDDDAGWVNIGKADWIFDNLIAAGKMKPMVVVMPEGHTPLNAQPLPLEKPATGAQPVIIPSTRPAYGLGAFTADLVGDVIPLVEASYRVKIDAAHRAIAGLSMGGGQSFNLSMLHSDKFAYVVLMSAGMRGIDDLNQLYPDVAAGKFKKGSPFKLYWIGCGKKDRLLGQSQKIDQWLNAQGIAHELHLSEGSHDWRVWRRNLVEISGRLFTAE